MQVSSTETMLRESGEYGYNIEAARSLANRGSTNHANSPISHYQDVPNMASGEVMTSYRGGQPYSYNGKPYYSVQGWEGSCPQENVDFNLNCQSYPILNNDPVHMVPYQPWPSRSKPSAPGSMYVDPDQAYPYNNCANLAHRPATSDSTNFSFSSVAASLPSAGTERLLPNPASTRTLPSSSNSTGYRGDSHPLYSSAIKPSGSPRASPSSSMTETPTTGYSSSFDNSSLAVYSSAGPAIPTHHSRASHPSPDPYSSSCERIFAAEERLNVGSQGSAVDINGYTYSSSGSGSVRRASGSGLSSRATSGDLSSGHAYMPTEELADSAHHGHHHPTASVTGSSASVAYTGSNAGSSGSGGGTTTDSRRSVVATRR